MRETAAEVIERHLLPEDRELRSVCELAEHLLPRGVGMHHGGMLPVLRELAEQFFKDGCIKVLFTIETFALGLNMPSRAHSKLQFCTQRDDRTNAHIVLSCK